MKKNILSTIGLTTVFAAAIIIASSLGNEGVYSVYANSNASPGAQTNSPGDGNNCTQCHTGSLNPGSATVTINSAGLISGYTPGQTYTINAGITGTTSSRIGFEVTAERDLNNAKIGSIVITDATRTIATNGGVAITHNSNTGTTAIGGSNAWTFDWTAPVAGTGNVTFYGAFNATNSSNNFIGDEVYVGTFSVIENTGAGVHDNANGLSFKLYPNPVVSSFEVFSTETIDAIEVYNLRGQKVMMIDQFTGKINVDQLPSGIYFVRIESDGKVSSQKLIKE